MTAFTKFAPGVRAELIYRDSNEDYICEVDCRLFFLGDNYKSLLKAYNEAVAYFIQIDDQRELFEALSASELINRFYEVCLENQQVSILMRDSVFRYPNAITSKDFDGWVQERGVNFMKTWDDRYQPLLASNDPGEQPLKGGMLRAKYGKGTYIYTGYAFFRQLPYGVPGAVRLYVNLLSAGHEPTK